MNLIREQAKRTEENKKREHVVKWGGGERGGDDVLRFLFCCRRLENHTLL